MIQLRLGPLTVRLEGISDGDIPENSLLFKVDADHKADISYNFHFVDSLQLPRKDDGWQIALSRHDILILRNGELEARLLAMGDMNSCYALYVEKTTTEADIYVINEVRNELRIDTIFASCLAFERRLARCGCYILHCSFLDYKGQAILFSGPSGIGKSTHSELWCKYIDGTRVLNGDRALICPTDGGGYEVHGWIVCGSSGICFNESRPLKAIVFMEQAAENSVREATPMQHFKMLTSQITINMWNTEQTTAAIDNLMALSSKINILTYACNMQPEAPLKLHGIMSEQGIIKP